MVEIIHRRCGREEDDRVMKIQEELEPIEPVDEAMQDLVMAVVRLQNLTDKNFVIIQLQDLLEEMTRSEP